VLKDLTAAGVLKAHPRPSGKGALAGRRIGR
jgi:hypothetical protein